MNLKNESINILQENKNEDQTNFFEKQLQENSDNISLWLSLADSYFKKEKYARALSCYMKILSYEPKNAFIWNKIAVVFLKMGENKSAIDISRIAFQMINNYF